MAYRVEQKIGNNIYIYEVWSYWDPQKKQARQKRRYIGKKDPETGKVITPRKSNRPRISKDYGHIYLMEEVARRIGLTGLLREVYGSDYRDILHLAYYTVVEGKPFYLYRQWYEMSYLEGGDKLSSQKISRLLEDVGKEERLREEFIRKWTEGQKDVKAILFDITSLSSYSRYLELLEWGYNRDEEKLPQINLGIIEGIPSGLPISYRIYPGSVADVATLKNVLMYVESLGLKETLFVLDRGFYSERNIVRMAEGGMGFILPLPFSTKLSRSLISMHGRGLTSPLRGFLFEDHAMFYVRDRIEIGGVQLIAHIYSDERRKALEVENFIRRLTDIEEAIKKRVFHKKEELTDFIEGILKGGSRYYRVVRVGEKETEVERRQNALSRRISTMGKMILITNKESISKEEILSLYRRKDFVEKTFNILKNEIEDKRVRVNKRTTLEGRLFISFLSLILYTALSNLIRESGLYKKYTLSEILYELKKIRIVEMLNGKKYLTEITKRQRTLYENLNIPIPFLT